MRDRNDQWCENEKFVNKGEASDHFLKGILFSLFILINTFFFVINILCRYELIRGLKLSVKILRRTCVFPPLQRFS